MKRTSITIALLFLLSLTQCSRAEDTLDTLNSLDCLEKAIDLNNRSDDMSCDELQTELTKLENSCREILDEDTKANIALLKALCED